MDASLSCRSLMKRYGRRTIVRDVTLEWQPGEVCALVVPNRPGKPSVVRLVSGSAFPTSGTVRMLGVDLRDPPAALAGGAGVGGRGLIGAGRLTVGSASRERVGACALIALAPVPMAMLAVLLTVVKRNAAWGALATSSALIMMNLLVFPRVEPYLLTPLREGYADPALEVSWMGALLALYSAAFAVIAMVVFERKDV